MAGSAVCLHDDVERARFLLGEAPIIAVNGAAKEYKALALVSQHPERFHSFGWIHKQRALFGEGFTVHSAGQPTVKGVDHWWTIERRGGSAWLARKIAYFLGFRFVVLCGCPFEAGPYVGMHNIGGFMHKEDIVDELRQQIKRDRTWHTGCYSMSGFTRELLGEPDRSLCPS